MGIFDKLFGQKGKTIIQCEEREYMVWKWQPTDKASNKVAIISKDATLLVNFGEVAVVIGNRSTGDTFTFIEGPYHDSLGNAYSGDASMVYFINMQGNNQVKFTVPYFDVADPRNVDLPVPVAVSGSFAFTISDYRGFVNLNRLDSFNLTDFNSQTKDALMRHVKSVVANIPIQYEIPLVSLESQISQVNEIVQKELAIRFMNDFGVTLKALDISAIRIDKESKAYTKLKSITQDISVEEAVHQAELKQKVADAEADVQIKDIRENQAEKMRVRREESDIDLMDKRKSVEEKHRVQSAELDIELMDKRKGVEEKYRIQRTQTEEAVRNGRINIVSPQINVGTMTDNLKKGIHIQPQSSNPVRPKLQQTGMMPPKPNTKPESNKKDNDNE